MSQKRNDPGTELFTTVNGVKQDAPLHAEMLDDPKAQTAIEASAIKRATASGMDRKTALRLYGTQK